MLHFRRDLLVSVVLLLKDAMQQLSDAAYSTRPPSLCQAIAMSSPAAFQHERSVSTLRSAADGPHLQPVRCSPPAPLPQCQGAARPPALAARRPGAVRPVPGGGAQVRGGAPRADAGGAEGTRQDAPQVRGAALA